MAKGKKRKAAPGDVATNRQAGYRFELLDRLETGIVLQGTEVKSLRNGAVQLKDGYAQVRDGELWLYNVHSRPTAPRAARTTIPSARASSWPTSARSNGSSARSRSAA